MAFRSYVLNLTGAAQRLSDAYGVSAAFPAGAPNPSLDITYRSLYLQGLKANANDVFVGMDNTVSSTNHGFRIDPGDTAQPITLEPSSPGSPLHLSDFWVIGTADEDLCIAGVPL